MTLSLSGWRQLAPLRRQFALQPGFLFVPVFVEDEAVARSVKLTLAEAWRARAMPWREVEWPEAVAAEDFRAEWLRRFDAAIVQARRDDTLVVDFASVVRHTAAEDLIPWINQRREPLRAAGVRLLVLWPFAIKAGLSGGAPDLWSMRAMNPVLKRGSLQAAREPGPRPLPSSTSGVGTHPPPMPPQPQRGKGWRAWIERLWPLWRRSEGVALWALFAQIDSSLEHGRAKEALPLALKAKRLAEANAAAKTSDGLRDLSVSHNKLGDVLRDLGRPEEARAAYAEGLALSEALRGQLGDTPQVLHDLAVSHDRLGDVLLRDLGRPEEARAAYAEGIALSEALRGQLGDTPQVLRDLSVSHEKLGDVLRDLGRPEEARAAYAEGLALSETLRGQLGDTPQVLRDLADSHERLGDVAREMGDAGQAQTHWQQALQLYRRLHELQGDSLGSLLAMRVPLDRLARAGDAAAQQELAALVSRLEAAAPDHPALRGARSMDDGGPEPVG